jgi:uncharacterized peroxidase-related enzyme
VALIDYLSADEAPEEARETLKEIEEEQGECPAYFEALAHSPDALGVHWDAFVRSMEGGELDRELKEFVYVAVSAANDCDYCAGAHTNVLVERFGGDEEVVEAVAEGDFDGLPERRRAVAEFAVQAATDPKRVKEEHLLALYEAGFGESEVVELTLVASRAVASNTLVDALNIHRGDDGKESEGEGGSVRAPAADDD